jgi:hypothetical protein
MLGAIIRKSGEGGADSPAMSSLLDKAEDVWEMKGAEATWISFSLHFQFTSSFDELVEVFKITPGTMNAAEFAGKVERAQETLRGIDAKAGDSKLGVDPKLGNVIAAANVFSDMLGMMNGGPCTLHVFEGVVENLSSKLSALRVNDINIEDASSKWITKAKEEIKERKTPKKLEQPPALDNHPRGDDSALKLSASWIRPTNDGPPISKYKLRLRKIGEVAEEASGEHPSTVTELTAEKKEEGSDWCIRDSGDVLTESDGELFWRFRNVHPGARYDLQVCAVNEVDGTEMQGGWSGRSKECRAAGEKQIKC